MSTIQSLTSFEVNLLIYSWFRKLTDHVAVDQMTPMLSDHALIMQFPEATLTSINEFKQWYHAVTHKYFDQVHELKMVDIALDGHRANVKLVVNWQARSWEAPAGYSKWDGVYAHQQWLVERLKANAAPVITRYIVESFEPMNSPLRI